MKLLILIASLICSTVSSTTPKPQSGTDDDVFLPLEPWSEDFDWDLLKELSDGRNNILVSPISLKIALALLYEGSSGTTQREFENVLKFTNKTSTQKKYEKIITTLKARDRTDYLLNLDTRIFLDSGIIPKQQFLAKSAAFYKTQVEKTEFSHPQNASDAINAWIDKLTNGKIEQLVRPEDLENNVMVIANAIYFKGTWRQQFPKNQTHYDRFSVTPDNTISVPFMTTTDQFYFYESNELDAKLLRLPYKGGRYSMFMILPNSKAGLPDLIKKINLMKLHQQLFQMEKTLVKVSIPKFKFEHQVRFNDVLQMFGLKDMFQNTASFASISRGNSLLRRLVVSDVIQKAGIELDEEGSVVYAATDVTIANKFGEPDHVFNAAHPFLFFIEEHTTGTILFMGKTENPMETLALPLPSRFGEGQIVPPIVPLNGIAESQVPNLQPMMTDYISNRFNYFDLELLQEFSETQENVFVSPASIKVALAMISSGAKGLGHQEIVNALRINDVDPNRVREVLGKLLFDLNDESNPKSLTSSNAMFVSNNLKVVPGYENTIQNSFRGSINKVDFTRTAQAAQAINSWVATATKNLIPELVSPQGISPDTSFILANALYFRGDWKFPFDKTLTKTMCFKSPTRGCLQTPMMQIEGYFNYNHDPELNAHAVELPYEGKYAMLILLPANGIDTKVLTRDIQHARFAAIVSNLKQAEIILQMPKFSMDFNIDLINFLTPLKIREVFTDKANLSGIVQNERVHINNIIHKTKIEVDERGTTAAAVTGAVVVPLMGSSADMIIADRPFLFFIYNKQSKNIIFEGILMDPTKNNPRFNNLG